MAEARHPGWFPEDVAKYTRGKAHNTMNAEYQRRSVRTVDTTPSKCHPIDDDFTFLYVIA